MKILLINEWYSPSLQNLIYYFSLTLGSNKFNWTGKRWYRKDFLPLTEIENSCLIKEPIALTKLQDQEYDFVIFSESSTYIFLSSHLSKTKKVFLDFMDKQFIPYLYWKNSDIYFKSQLPKKEVWIHDNSFNSKKQIITEYSQENLYPICLNTSYKCVPESKSNYQHIIRKENDVFFIGSAWPTDRTFIVSVINAQKDINFYGGLYNRKDLEFNNIIPDSLKHSGLDSCAYKRKIIESKICLNLVGNGNNCFRQFEILDLGSFLLAQKHNCYFAQKEPEDKKHCVYFRKDGSDIIDIILDYINNPDELSKIAKEGHRFYRENLHPKSVVQYILNILGEYN